jgi:hypothetical protein
MNHSIDQKEEGRCQIIIVVYRSLLLDVFSGIVSSVADPGCLPRIRLFSIPDPNCLHPGS